MKSFVIGIFIAFGALPAVQAEKCWSPEPSNLTLAGRDNRGYFVRTDPNSPYGSQPVQVDAQAIGDPLAREASATIVYLGNLSLKRVAGEWRGETPFAALKTFAEAAGFSLVAPSKDFWVIGWPERIANGAVRIFSYPIDPSGQGWLSQRDVGDVERALVSQLPVRSGGNVGVGYYWVPGEGRDVLLVVVTNASGSSVQPPPDVFKVKLNRSGPEIRVECQWSAQGGVPVLGIEEDFDGDGYRDFVFEGGEEWPGVILSGKDGHVLAQMLGGVGVVEKATSGPKRFVASSWDAPGSKLYVFQYSKEDGKFSVPGLKPTRQDREAMLAEAARITREVAAASQTPEQDPVKVLRKELGGAQNVRLYIFPGMRGPLYAEKSSAEIVRLSRSNYEHEMTPERIKAGFPARILFEYKSPGYVVYEEKLNKQLEERAREPHRQRSRETTENHGAEANGVSFAKWHCCAAGRS